MIHYEEERFGTDSYIEYARHTNFSFPAHFHRCLELVYMLEGEMDILYDTQQITLSSNDAALFLPNDIHGYETKHHASFISLVFSPEWIIPFMKQVEGKKAISPKFVLKDAFLNQYLIHLETHLSNTLKTQGFLLLLCGTFLEQARLVNVNTSANNLLHQIISYTNSHFKEDVSLSSLAQSLGYDSSYLSRFISQHMHTTFHTYLTELRLAHATYLLKNTDEKIIHIAMQSGFSSIRTFNGVFKKAYGLSPIQYKHSL